MGNISSTGRTSRRNKTTRSAPDARARLPRNRARNLQLSLNHAALREVADNAAGVGGSGGGGRRRSSSSSRRKQRRSPRSSNPTSPSALHPSTCYFHANNDVSNGGNGDTGDRARIMLPDEYPKPPSSPFRRRLLNTRRYSHSYSELDRDADGLQCMIAGPLNDAADGADDDNAPNWHPVDREDFNDPFYEEPLSPPEPAHTFRRDSFHSTSAHDSPRRSDEPPNSAASQPSRKHASFLAAERSFNSTCSGKHCSSYSSRSFEEQIVVLNDRRYQAHDDVPYPLPNDAEEGERLENMHRILHGVLKNNFISPLDEPKMALDVGCGPGLWMSEMANEFPDCTFTGLDISNLLRSEPLPANCQFKQGNALKTLRFRPDTFDYIHQRMFALSLPRRHWPRICREYKRILQPDGWLEFIETDGRYFRTGPIGDRINDWLKSMYAARGLEPRRCCLLPEMLSDAGFPVVLRRVYSLPVGDWGKRLGQAVLSNTQLMLRAMWPHIQAALPTLSWERFEEAVFMHWPAELDEHKTYLNLRVYWCQKE